MRSQIGPLLLEPTIFQNQLSRWGFACHHHKFEWKHALSWQEQCAQSTWSLLQVWKPLFYQILGQLFPKDYMVQCGHKISKINLRSIGISTRKYFNFPNLSERCYIKLSRNKRWSKVGTQCRWSKNFKKDTLLLKLRNYYGAYTFCKTNSN